MGLTARPGRGVPAVHDVLGTRQTAGFRDGAPDGSRLESDVNGGDEMVGLAPRGAYGVAGAGDSGKAMAARQGSGVVVPLDPDQRPMRTLGSRSTPRAAACS